jgi:hypothetical protein
LLLRLGDLKRFMVDISKKTNVGQMPGLTLGFLLFFSNDHWGTCKKKKRQSVIGSGSGELKWRRRTEKLGGVEVSQ